MMIVVMITIIIIGIQICRFNHLIIPMTTTIIMIISAFKYVAITGIPDICHFFAPPHYLGL